MRILQLVYSLDVGGLEQVVADLCRGLAPFAECHLGCLSHLGPKAVGLPLAGTWIGHVDPSRRFLKSSTLFELCRYIQHHRINVIHSHNAQAHPYGSLATLFTPAKHIHTVHGSGNSGARNVNRRAFLRRSLTRLTDRVVAVSKDVERRVLEIDRLPPAKVSTIINGVSTAVFTPLENPDLQQQLRGNRGIPPDAFVIGSVGRLSREKNYPLLIHSLSQFQTDCPFAFAVIVGEGRERPVIESTIQEHHLSTRIILPGAKEDIADWLRCFDVFVLPSDTEGTSISLLEAMATGLPVVATDVGGNRELVDPPIGGLIVPSRDPDGLAQAYRELYQVPARRAQMGQAARARVVGNFSLTAMVQTYYRLYESLFPNGRP